MRTTTPLLLALTVAIAACGSDRDETADDSMMDDTAGAATAPVARNLMLDAMNSSGASGEVTLTAIGDSTSVAVRLAGAAANASLQEHIHSGTCEAQGPVVMPLDPLVTDSTGAASATTMVNLPMSTVANGQHYIQAHGPDGAPTACANISAMSEMM